jgi:CRISPR-associated protein Cmr6
MPEPVITERPQPRAAVPDYVGGDFTEAPPGHRFGLYLRAWDEHFKLLREKKRGALQEVARLGPYSSQLVRAVRGRQARVARTLGPQILHFPARSTSPFIAGTGIEHPLENGFAFLGPYGVPYLPGSGVKGVVRRAAEELALGLWEDRRGWDIASVWWLFGFEAGSVYLAGPTDKVRADVVSREALSWRARFRDAIRSGRIDLKGVSVFVDKATGPETGDRYVEDPEAFLDRLAEERMAGARSPRLLREEIHFKGALRFWDALIEPAGDSLTVDILNPHFGDYYQEGDSPADCGQPVPNFFLTVPPGSRFDFFMQVEGRRLPEELSGKWHTLVETAFRLAFDWLGFGAKGAVGYGRMERVAERAEGGTGTGSTVAASRSDFEVRIEEIRALPRGGAAAGQVGRFVDWCLELADPERQCQAAREIISCMSAKWVKGRAKRDERWRKILDLGGVPESDQS